MALLHELKKPSYVEKKKSSILNYVGMQFGLVTLIFNYVADYGMRFKLLLRGIFNQDFKRLCKVAKSRFIQYKLLNIL